MDAADEAQAIEALERDFAIARASAMPAGTQKRRDGVVVCVDCGEPVPAKRLVVLPRASRCVDCQEIQDSGH